MMAKPIGEVKWDGAGRGSGTSNVNLRRSTVSAMSTVLSRRRLKFEVPDPSYSAFEFVTLPAQNFLAIE